MKAGVARTVAHANVRHMASRRRLTPAHSMKTHLAGATVVALCMLPRLMAAQHPGGAFLSVGVGPGLEDARWSTERQILGFVGEIAAGARPVDRIGVRAAASFARFHSASPAFSIVCPPGSGCVPPSNQLSVGSLTGDLLLYDAGSPATAYFVLGAGAARFYNHPTFGEAARGIAQVGFGQSSPLGTRVQLQFEARYRRLFGSGNGPRWDLPITIGIRV